LADLVLRQSRSGRGRTQGDFTEFKIEADSVEEVSEIVNISFRVFAELAKAFEAEIGQEARINDHENDLRERGCLI
jgi:hypothetical protein